MNPVITLERFEKAAVKEGNLAAEASVIVIVTFNGQGFVKKWFEDIVEKIDCAFDLVLTTRCECFAVIKQVTKEALFATAPFGITFNSEPSLFLEEVEKDDLTEKLFCKVSQIDMACLEVIPDRSARCQSFLKCPV